MPSGVPNFSYKDHSPRPPLDRSALNPEQDEEIELGLDDGNEAVSAELQELYTSFQTCIELRDKYIALSCQRLEDNPNNYDGEFAPATGSTSTSASRPASPEHRKGGPLPSTSEDGLPSLAKLQQANGGASRQQDPWRIYPPPPRPHWDPKDPFDAQRSSAVQQQAEFRFEDCDIPGEHPFVFELDSQGVYQVYDKPGLGGFFRLGASALSDPVINSQREPVRTPSIAYLTSESTSKISTTFSVSYRTGQPSRMPIGASSISRVDGIYTACLTSTKSWLK